MRTSAPGAGSRASPTILSQPELRDPRWSGVQRMSTRRRVVLRSDEFLRIMRRTCTTCCRKGNARPINRARPIWSEITSNAS
jgi:hypothetical protein